jgi:hypothetical protein
MKIPRKRSRKNQGDEHGWTMSDEDLPLKIELIPRPLWGQNLRTIMGKARWLEPPPRCS